MDVKEIIEDFNNCRQDRNNWDAMFQIVGEYISQNKQNFQAEPQAGAFLVNEIYDAQGIFAAHASASALLGMLWTGSAARDIEITHPDDLEPDSELSEFYDQMNKKVARAFDDPKANLNLSLDEYMKDQIIFGTSGLGVERGYESKLLFKAYGVKESYIDEGRNGRVNTEYFFYEWTVRRVVAEFGIDKVSEKTREKFNNGKRNEKIKILYAVCPRLEKKALKGKLAMDYMGVIIEYDNKHLLKEDGFHEIPVNFGRFTKNNYEKYGRSPAMNALPDIREANALREAVIIATEKTLDMPKGVLSDGVFGGGVIDTSAHAINVFDASSAKGSTPPIFDIGSPPDIAVALNRLEALNQSISQHFFVDRLLDFNNQTSMTFGEAQLRDQIRASSLSALFSRQITEVMTPTFERAINLMWRDGEFGVIKGSDEEKELIKKGKPVQYLPDTIVERLQNNEDIYQVTYKTRAANAARAEDYSSILDVANVIMQMAQVDPSLRHRVDLHQSVKELAKIRGVANIVIRQDDEVEELMQKDQQQQQAAETLEAGQAVGGIAKDLAQAEAANAGNRQ